MGLEEVIEEIVDDLRSKGVSLSKIVLADLGQLILVEL